MSVWTHVAGVVRFDDFRIFNDGHVDWDVIFGKELRYTDYDAWDDYDNDHSKYMPAGSEGSLQKTVWENPDRNCAAAYTVTVFGDLRDYDDPDAIIQWFKKVLDESGMSVRNAVITTESEYGVGKTYVYGGIDND